jgi:hypothetical protein
MIGQLFTLCLSLALSASPNSPTVELADENLSELLSQIVVEKAKVTDLVVERSDVFSGLESIKQSGNERHTNNVKGWAYKIVETPKAAGEFRYLRFAWRKEGGGSILLAFAVNGNWNGKRYSAGPYNLGGSGFSTGEKAPVEWTVVTRDMFKDFGEITLTSILFSSSNSGTARFDHVVLGKTIEDLDRNTAEALGKGRLKDPLAGNAREALWEELIGGDKAKANAAFRKFLAVAPDQVGYIRSKLFKPKVDLVLLARISSFLKQLESEDFDQRQTATEALREIGTPAVPQLLALMEREDSPEATYRSKAILLKLGVKPGDAPPGQARAARIVRILERANTAEAKKLLNALADGEYGNEYISESRTALVRMKGTT